MDEIRVMTTSENRFAALVVAVATIAGCGSPRVWKPPSAPDDVTLRSDDLLKRSVVRIESRTGSDPGKEGSGIVIGYQEGTLFLMTALHVVTDLDGFEFDSIHVWFEGDPHKMFRARMICNDERKDFAVLTIDGFYDDKRLGRIAKLPVDLSFDYGRASTIRTLGHPGDRAWHLATGTSRPTSDGIVMEFSGEAAEEGNSGGPILSPENRLVGMVTAVEGSTRAFALKLPVILNQLDDWKIPYRPRLVAEFGADFESVLDAAWMEEWEPLMGSRIEHVWSVYRAKISLAGNSVIASYSSSGSEYTAYVARLGKYGTGVFLDEAWRLWVREIGDAVIATGQEYKVEDRDDAWGRRLRFWRYKGFAWPSSRRVNIEIMEHKIAGEIYLMVYSFQTDIDDVKKARSLFQ